VDSTLDEKLTQLINGLKQSDNNISESHTSEYTKLALIDRKKIINYIQKNDTEWKRYYDECLLYKDELNKLNDKHKNVKDCCASLINNKNRNISKDMVTQLNNITERNNKKEVYVNEFLKAKKNELLKKTNKFLNSLVNDYSEKNSVSIIDTEKFEELDNTDDINNITDTIIDNIKGKK